MRPRSLAVPGLPLLLFVLSAPSAAGTRVSLDGPWQFRIDHDGTGERSGWARTVPADVETVDVPHTWGVGRHAEHEGIAWYWRVVRVPPSLIGHPLELHFGATFYEARVFVNGTLVGEHEGGHTAWRMDVTRALGRGGVIAVELDNRPGLSTIPGWAMRLKDTGSVWYDWWHYGGIVRDVALVAQERVAIRRQEIRPKVDAEAATVVDRVFLERLQPGGGLEVRAEAYDPGGRPLALARQQVEGASGPVTVPLSLPIAQPKLWHFDQPNLYRLVVEVRDAATGGVLDRREDAFGLRTVEIRDRGLWLNGERVRLTGITRHEESTQEGLAETRGTILYDWNDLKNLNVVLTRPVHYPQHPDVLDYADRDGVLLVPEIPMWQFSEEQMKDPKVLALAKRMMQEMIEQAGNHPSVLGWSVCNESATSTAGGRAYVEAMVDHVKALDPGRFVSYADDGLAYLTDPALDANQYTDFIMMNQYFGSWAGPAQDLAPALERVGRMFPDKMVVISEFGLAGPFAPDAQQADVMRTRIMKDQLAEFARHDFVAGAVFWCYQDYKSHRNLWPGETSGYVNMGLVDQDRQRQPSYEAWKEETSPARLAFDWTRSGYYAPPTGFKVTVARRPPTELPSYDLRGYRLEWQARDHDGTVLARGARDLPTIGVPVEVDGSWPATRSREIRVALRVLRPTGFVAAERTERWWEPRSGGLSPEEAATKGLATPRP
ncbi:MAG TPA: glycoside hydrolase family 2 TIM barrel-domain containing protein [Vicinamibacteria bacterium]|nr:glycoside hydrolase family 2 TIM barrel-domain containing protein [Vicinamibacteria bacterium]